MTIYYSPSTNGLYPDGELYGAHLPPDAIVLSLSQYQGLIEGQAAGKVITPNGSEVPYLSEPVVNYSEQANRKLTELRAKADTEILPLQDAVDLAMASDDEVTRLNEWKAYRLALYRLDISDAENIAWPVVPTGGK
ncbi:tail fiber assembly protein [Klebsiella variicola]|uniref:tail fiber assembly protein n=1 Tax=Klebsiella variicola TaxID=244366 RepID=UPI000D745610|nr:tail fiber assembly protein [Klebsiella variicola]PXK69887.1 phage tail protein [Klebsiella variicola]